MAAIAANRVGIGQICPNFNTLNPKKSHTQFLGKPLLFKPQLSSLSTLKSRKRCMVIGAGFELFDPVRDLFVGVGVGLPCTVMECGDIIYRSTLPRSNGLTLTVPGVILALGTVSCLWATPGVAPGFWDMFVLAFVERIFRPTFKKDDFVLGKKLGEGAFGVVYKVSLANNKKPSVKEGDLVVKKATEYGAVEIWMNERVRRACASSCADVLYGFMEKSSKKEGEYWLVWRFEGESTLSDLLTSREFPYNVDCCNRSIYRGGEFGYTRLVATKKKLTLSYVGNHDGEVHDTVEILATGEVLSGSGSASGEKTEFPDTVLEGGMASPIFSQFVKGGSVLLLGAFVGYVIGFVSCSRKETPASGNSWLPVKTEDS